MKVMSQHPLSRIGFLIPGNFEEHDPLTGLEHTLHILQRAEVLGYNSAWVRQRHLERGISSAATFLAAATQRTRTIELGTAVIPWGMKIRFGWRKIWRRWMCCHGAG